MPPYSQCDNQIAQLFSKMQKNGLTEQEIYIYSLAYFQNDEIHYFATAKYPAILSFQQYCNSQNFLPTTINHTFFYKMFSADEYSSILRDAKINSIKYLSEIYPIDYFRSLQKIMPVISNDAYPFLHDWFTELEGIFDYGTLSLFEYACQLAFSWRILDELHLYIFTKRLAHIYTQIDNISTDTSLPAHQYAAFAYLDDSAKIQYQIGSLSQIIKKHLNFECQEIFVSPIYQKTYYFLPTSFVTTLKHKNEFEQEAKSLLNQAYMNKISALRALVAFPDKKRQSYYRSHPLFENTIVQQNFKLYARRWKFL